ncbi:MAG: 30S ribosomal protein S12 methylthiotransferase RimO [Candidatus Delongbacteria bacterium]|jgi:ribosomal protein S12 methylthiotransferase|nr:30S ribosomal protein S12 methylthiotransferase RimO [Candidatus Delongbacteria bacterium]
MKKIKIITLGCDKNLVDSEIIAGQLSNKYEVSPDFTEGEAIIVNTCGFIGDAKEESIDTIFRAVEQKKFGKFKKVFITGCLAERYYKDLKKDLKEVDGVYHLKDFKGIVKELIPDYKPSKDLFNERLALEMSHVAYVRISDGCNHNCSYCAIPSIRGKYTSRTEESILSEVQMLKKANVKEIILIGQEISSYGTDLYKENRLIKLLTKISMIAGKEMWIRLLYTHPPLVTDEFVEFIAKTENICNYLDFPIEHSETEILKAMYRKDSREGLLEKIKFMRKTIPNITLRTSIITGFPGETRKVFNNMLKFIKEAKFERLGVFAFSPEEDTDAIDLTNRVTRKTALKRVSEIMDIQQELSYEFNQTLIGNIEKVLIDRVEGEYSIGRTFRDTPDVDCEVLIKGSLDIGEFYQVKIIDATEFDLMGELV